MTTTRPAATRDAATTRTETNDEDDAAIATTRDAAIETVRRVVVARHHAWCQQFVFTRLTTTATATQAMTTLARARDDAVRRARESYAETRGDGVGDDAIARAKRAVTLGRRVSEKTTRRIDVDGGGETRRTVPSSSGTPGTDPASKDRTTIRDRHDRRGDCRRHVRALAAAAGCGHLLSWIVNLESGDTWTTTLFSNTVEAAS